MPKPDEPPTDFPYASLVGSLIWLTKTRPDISYAVSQCSRFLNTHTEDHFFFFFFFFEADFIQLVVLNLSHLNYIKLCLFLTSNER